MKEIQKAKKCYEDAEIIYISKLGEDANNF
jgi:hypothetical protein